MNKDQYLHGYNHISGMAWKFFYHRILVKVLLMIAKTGFGGMLRAVYRMTASALPCLLSLETKGLALASSLMG
jgi:hypothetical protein